MQPWDHKIDKMKEIKMEKPWDYDIDKAKQRLFKIKERYFSQRLLTKGPKGFLSHHGDCDIYRSMNVYGTAPCTCGLLHDLRHLPGDIAEKLRPNWHDELFKMDGMTKPTSPEEQAECEKMLREAFPVTISPSQADWEVLEYQEWELIEEVFGKPFRDDKEFEQAELEDKN